MHTLFEKFIRNHVLANLCFVLVILLGVLTYSQMPRERDPSINFNWIQITTVYPGASAQDVEKKVTEHLEDAIRKVSDIRFVSSVSRDSVSSILVRFRDIPEKRFNKRINDLRREIQNQEKLLPQDAQDVKILEITSANGFPTASMAITSKTGDDEQLRQYARNIQKRLEREKGIDKINTLGLQDPEIQIHFDPHKLNSYGITPVDIANSLKSQFIDVSAGNVNIQNSMWVTRWLGTVTDPQSLATIPIMTANGEVPLQAVASIQKGRERARNKAMFNGENAVILIVRKMEAANVLELVDRINDIITEINADSLHTGIEAALIDDQTFVTENALGIMQNNAAVGLLLVLFSTWLFLGLRIAAIVSIGIPFTLAATFLFLHGVGFTLNISVLLGVVISLGMLVDDSVVVVESIYYRLQRGMDKYKAIVSGLKEVFAPVTTSILTTVCAFIPLMLLPGILGKFMFVIPLVVTMALLFSLVEAYWMLPAHIGAIHFSPKSIQQKDWRARFTHKIRTQYTKFLIKIFRYPFLWLAAFSLLLCFTIFSISAGWVKTNFFAMDPMRIFYINVEMPANTPVSSTLQYTHVAEKLAKEVLEDIDLRQTASYAGLMFTETEALEGDNYGQVIVSLKPHKPGMREVDEIIAATRDKIQHIAGPKNVSLLKLSGGPPQTKPINVKVRGDNFNEIRQAVNTIGEILGSIEHVFNIGNNDTSGQAELNLYPNFDSIKRLQLNPSDIARITRLLADGELITELNEKSDTLKVRVQATPTLLESTEDLLQYPIALHSGGSVRLKDLVHAEYAKGQNDIRHYNFRKTISVTADINKSFTDTLTVNNLIKAAWKEQKHKHPGIDLDFSGELDDIEESLNAMPKLFLIGIGLIYLLLGTQFKSYWQPFMVLTTVPLAFCGVTLGLLVTRHPLSLYTLYGVVALSGIAVNAAIVLISAANSRMAAGMSAIHSILFAARRRVIPILITSLTTIAGLFSLATGLGGKSLLWGPVATAIVWGLVVSTTLTLLVIPLIYRFFMYKSSAKKIFNMLPKSNMQKGFSEV